MLRKITPFGKLFFDEVTAVDLYNTFYACFCKETELCPCCRAGGDCNVHGYYKRYLVDYCNGMIISKRIRILRLICKTCGHTHAVLPDIIVPYAQYSVRFICWVVSEKLTTALTIDEVCRKFDISYKTLYRFLEIYKEHKSLWLGVLESTETSQAQFLNIIGACERFSDFMSAFSKRFVSSFLQRHANPTNSCQKGTKHLCAT